MLISPNFISNSYMRTITVTLSLFFLFSASGCYSQGNDAFNKVYNTQTIYQFGNRYMKGNQPLTYRDLAMEFNTPRTHEMYLRSKRKLFIGRMFNVASLGVIIASIFVKSNTGGSVEFAVGTGLLGLGGLYFQTESARYVQRALWERNRDVLDAGAAK